MDGGGGYSSSNNIFNGISSSSSSSPSSKQQFSNKNNNHNIPKTTVPTFVVEPPNVVIFLSTTGTVVPCHIKSNSGQPFIVSWQVLKPGGGHDHDFVEVTNIPGLRLVREDGSLALLPFKDGDFNPNVHLNTYRCIGSSSKFGLIASRRINVRSG